MNELNAELQRLSRDFDSPETLDIAKVYASMFTPGYLENASAPTIRIRKKKVYEFFIDPDSHQRKIIVNILNRRYDNVIAKAVVEVPELTDKNINYIIYALAGFSVASISVILDEAINSVYVRRHRLRAILSKSDTESARVLLCLLD